ncbi:Dihydrdoorotate oxidase B, electron transfer subunit [Bhargavaea cecembensis DSE10]|uniref:Dihydrdoorotate oxidase B, electron transfer subunit n=1 Tax=Bhargavaea cecembensis DSE10 TaxID=1235279 RepID=M7NY43_9BACL|nr:dihydroorotate dehydrogenase electron transfer subunit [Bhargavaea cecembensis]EMR06605.1 Dihydrdoorotate oxidase B, electron transfer subunit [Bhargavaea cecembensis DSE10]
MQSNKLSILEHRQVSVRYWHMVVSAQGLTEQIRPGQFFNILCGNRALPFLRRPFSIYRINREEETIEFLYLVQGAGTREMTNMKVGESIDLLGPFGIGFTLDEQWETVLLLARGVGIATLAALAQEAVAQGKQCIAILSARSRNDLLAADTLQGLGVDVLKVTEEDGNSDVTQVEELIMDILDKRKIDAGFTCGSKRLSRLMQKVSINNGFPAQVALEEHMACAMGACFACVCDIREGDAIKSVRICTEGPVFDLSKVVMA